MKLQPPLRLIFFCLLLSSATGCQFFAPNSPRSVTTESGERITLTDATVKQYVAEWHDAKPSIDRLTDLESDLHFLLSEVSRMSDLGNTPGLNGVQTGNPVIRAPEATSSSNMSDGNFSTDNNNLSGLFPNHTTKAFCPEPFSNNYKKSMALAVFPRMQPTTSSLGALHQVEQHLPMLLSANLRNRHAMLTPLQLRQGFANNRLRSENQAATQAQQLARQNRVQFIVSGEVDDMSMKFPNSVSSPSHYTRFVNGAHNLLHINTPIDKRSRIFSFNVEVRDGITGQVVYTNQYSTFGHWKPSPGIEVGFASARFWQTEYGQQVQQLVAKASDDIAQVIHCQPYMATVDARPGQNLMVVHSGSNNGLRTGDALDLYQLVQQPATGNYQQYDMRLVKSETKVYLTETYPSHSVAHVADDRLMNGQYLVRAP